VISLSIIMLDVVFGRNNRVGSVLCVRRCFHKFHLSILDISRTVYNILLIGTSDSSNLSGVLAEA